MSPKETSNSNHSPPRNDFRAVGTERKEVLYDGWYYDVTDFAKRHPGGEEIMLYYCARGEDATLAIQQFHYRSMSKISGIMKSLKRRPATDLEEIQGSLTLSRNEAMTADFNKLFKELKEEGLFEPSYSHLAYRIVEMILIGVFGIWIINSSSNVYITLLGCFIYSMAQGRAGWIQHECSHHSFTGNPKVDRVLQGIFFGTLVGIASSWWRAKHNKHHAMASRVHHDTDLNTLPLLVYNMKVMDDPKRQQNFFIRNQQFLAPLDALIAGLYWMSWETGRHLYKHRYGYEFASIGLYYCIVSTYFTFWTWLLTSWITAGYLLLNLGLSHSFLPVTTKPEHWVEQAFLYTTDVEQRPWCNWWMGYLNYQIEHHLFPTMPQFRNPLIVDRVKALATKYGLPYHCCSYWDAVWKTANNVIAVAEDVAKLSK